MSKSRLSKLRCRMALFSIVIVAASSVHAEDLKFCREPESYMIDHRGGREGFEGPFWGSQDWFHPESGVGKAVLGSLRKYDDLRHREEDRTRAARAYATVRGLAEANHRSQGVAVSIERDTLEQLGVSASPDDSNMSLDARAAIAKATFQSADDSYAKVLREVEFNDKTIKNWSVEAFRRFDDIRKARYEEWGRTGSTDKYEHYMIDALQDIRVAVQQGAIPLRNGTDFRVLVFYYDFRDPGRTGDFPGTYSCLPL